MAVRIVTDSTSDIPPALATELGISVVPLSVIFGDEAFREGVDISQAEFYDKLVRSRVLPTTSAPSVGDFLAVYEPLLKDTDEIVSIHISSKLSATYNIACQAAKRLAERGARVEVIDSQSVSFGLTFMAAAAARAAVSGAGIAGGDVGVDQRHASAAHALFWAPSFGSSRCSPCGRERSIRKNGCGPSGTRSTASFRLLPPTASARRPSATPPMPRTRKR